MLLSELVQTYNENHKKRLEQFYEKLQGKEQ